MKSYLLLIAAFTISYCAKVEGVLTRPDCLRVNVQSNSAILHWRPHTSTKRLNYMILCTGTYYEVLANGTLAPSADFVTRYVPMEQHNLTLLNLKSNSSYSCIVEAEGIGAGRPCHFITNRPNGYTVVMSNKRSWKLSQFRAGYNRMAASILLGGVLPLSLIAGCIGSFIIIRKFQNYHQKVEHLRKYQRLPAFMPPGDYGSSPGRSPVSYNNTSQTSPYQTIPMSPYQKTSPYQTTQPILQSPYQTTQPILESSNQNTHHILQSPYPISQSPHQTTQPILQSPYQTITPHMMLSSPHSMSPTVPSTQSGRAYTTQPTNNAQPLTVVPSLPITTLDNQSLSQSGTERDMSYEFEKRGIVFKSPPSSTMSS